MKKEKAASYLSQLRFDPKLEKSFQGTYLRNVRLPILIILTIIIVGIFGFVAIPRRLNPEINIPIILVNTTLPGANPEDVESLITIPLERSLAGVEGLDTLDSTSRDSVSTISLQFVSGTNIDKARNDVQTAVNTVTDLPTNANTPNIQSLDFENQPVWTFAITAKNGDTASLMRFADALKKKVENLAKVDRVETSGLDTQEIEVTVDPLKAQEYNLSPPQLSQVVKSAVQSFPAGVVNSSNSSFSLTIDTSINSVDDIRNLRIQLGTTSVRLGDIAVVAYRSKNNQSETYLASKHADPARVVQFFVFKKKSANIDAAYNDVKPVVDVALKPYDGNFSLFSVENTSERITKQFDDLNREFTNTSILVFILLLIFLGLRQGIISNVTVPLTFLATFAVINAFGLSLNFLTVFSFLLSLGILIDDTIVVVAAMTRYYATGKLTPYQTGILVWRDFIIPLWSSAITTIWGFVPLLLSTGIIGEFIKSIPIVVTVTMLSSTLISIFITIPLMIIFLKPQFPKRVKILFAVLGILAYILVFTFILPHNSIMPIAIFIAVIFLLIAYRIRSSLASYSRNVVKNNKRVRSIVRWISSTADKGIINVERLSNSYRSVIEKILDSKRSRRRTLVAIIAFTLVAYLLLPAGLVKNEFFPKSDENLIYVNVELPSGANVDQTTKEAQNLLKSLRNTPLAEYVVAEVGQSFTATGDRSALANSILFTIHLPDKDSRHTPSYDIAETIRQKYQSYNKGKFSVVELSGGPPAGADVQVNLRGDDLGVLDGYANQIITFLQKQKGITNVDKSIKSGTSKVVFVPDKSKMADAGLTPDAVGLWLRTYATGFTLDSVRLGKVDKDDIVFRTSEYDKQSISDLSSLEIPTQSGQKMPLLSLGSLRLETNPTIITRENQKRTISVFGSVTKGYIATEKNTELLNYVKKINFQEGYGYETGGVNEENQKSVTSILQAMGLAFMLIFFTMVVEFGSFRQAVIAMAMIPISVAGVFYIFALTRTPLSFAALIGVLALFGIVMRHAIVVMEKINENRAHGLTLHDAIADAASSRLEPVLLTSLATIAGLIPITVADPFWRGLGGTIIAGLLFTGALKLFFIPVVYYDFFQSEEPKNTRKIVR